MASVWTWMGDLCEGISSKPRKRGVLYQRQGAFRVALRRGGGASSAEGLPHMSGVDLPPHAYSHLETKYGLGICSAQRREKTRKRPGRLFSSSSERMLTDGIHFRHRIDSRSQMNHSSNYRAVLGTPSKNWRGRWSVLRPSWIFSRFMKVRGCEEGRDGMGDKSGA